MNRLFLRQTARAGLGAMLLFGSVKLEAAIPPAVEAMIREAAHSGDKATLDAVVKVAKATNAGEAEAIGALGDRLLAEAQTQAAEARRVALASQGLLDGWTGEGQVGFGLTSGNTRETSAVVGVALRRDGLYTRHKLTGMVDYLRSNGITTRQKYALDYALNVVLSEQLYAVGTLGWERDKFAGHARRFTESLGLGYRAIDRTGMKLDLEAGPALRQTRFVAGGSRSEVDGRASLAWRWTVNEGLLLSEDASALVGGNNATLVSTSALTAKLNGALSGRLSFNVEKETEPQAGRKSTDTATRFTLVYDF